MERMHLKRWNGPRNWSSPFSNAVILEPLRVDVTPHSVFKRLGRGISEKKWMRLVEKACRKYACRIRPRGLYRLVFCRPNGRAIELGHRHRFTSAFLRDRLPQPAPAAIFLATIGPALEREIRDATARKDNRTAFILDCLGSNAAESTAAAVHREVERRLGALMRRYSPGYNDWDISEQKILFDFVGKEMGNRIGVDLSSDYMMSPRKSISGIVLPRIEEGAAHAPAAADHRYSALTI